MAEEREQHKEYPNVEAKQEEHPSSLAGTSTNEKAIHIFGQLAGGAALFAGGLAATKHWGLLCIVAFIAAVFMALAIVLKLHTRYRWLYFTLLVAGSGLACYGLYYLIVKDSSSSDQAVKIADPPQPTQPRAAPTLQSTATPTVALTARTASTPTRKATEKPSLKDQQNEGIHPDVLATGAVDGIVFDANTRDRIQGATVVAKNLKTGITYQTASRFDGQFSTAVPVGEYTVTVTCPGYITATGHYKALYGSSVGNAVWNLVHERK